MAKGIHCNFLPLVTAFVFDPAHIDRLHRIFDGRATLAVYETEHAVRTHLASEPVDMLVASLESPDGTPTVPLLADLHLTFPHIPIVVYARLTQSDMQYTLAAGRAGLDSVIVHEAGWSPQLADDLLSAAQVHTLVGYLEPELRRIRSEHARRYIQHCLTHAAEPATVQTVTTQLHVSRQHVARELAGAGMRDPQWYLRASRILLAAKLLDAPSVSVEHVARVLHFPSSTALRQGFREYFGATATQVRANGGFAHALTIVRDAIAVPLQSPPISSMPCSAPTDVPVPNICIPSGNGGRSMAGV